LSIVFVPRVVRVAESATVQVKSLEYIAAARASGAGVPAIVRHHLLANVLGPILVFASTQVSLSIILAARLSFLGLGVTPPAAETLGIVGESGCGKSTLARLILRLIEPDAGSVRFAGEDVRGASADRMKRLRRDMQLVFQDQHASLNPRLTIEDAVAFSLLVH